MQKKQALFVVLRPFDAGSAETKLDNLALAQKLVKMRFRKRSNVVLTAQCVFSREVAGRILHKLRMERSRLQFMSR